MHHVFKYPTGIVTDMKSMFVEQAVKLRFGAVRALFPMKRPPWAIPCSLCTCMIHTIIVQRMKQKKNPTKTSFALKSNSQSWSILHIFHSVNAIGALLATILGSYVRKGVCRCVCSATSNTIHPLLGRPTDCVSIAIILRHFHP